MSVPGAADAFDRRPYVATAAVLVVALGLNFYTGNGLWTYYTLVGAGLFLAIAGLVRARRWRIPAGAVWMAGVAGALHFVGGSLAGLHVVGGVNGLYAAFPWWDNVTHALGAAAVAVAACAVLGVRAAGIGRGMLAFIGVAVATLVGVLVELYEFSQYVFLGTVDQGFYTNTLLDLYYNLLGATVAAVIYTRWVVPSASAMEAARPGDASALD